MDRYPHTYERDSGPKLTHACDIDKHNGDDEAASTPGGQCAMKTEQRRNTQHTSEPTLMRDGRSRATRVSSFVTTYRADHIGDAHLAPHTCLSTIARTI